MTWLIELVKEDGIHCPKTLIFCNGTLTDISVVTNFLLQKLGKYAYDPQDCQVPENCLIGIDHSLTPQKYKDRIVQSFKGDEKKRIAVTTTVLSMGVHFPDVRYIVHWGPPRDLLDYHQKSGRAGRDGLTADVVTYFYGQQLSHCELAVKNFVNSTGCYRVAAYNIFDKGIAPSHPPHSCCKNCAMTCKCSNTKCVATPPKFEQDPTCNETEETTVSRPVSDTDKDDLKNALEECIDMMMVELNVFAQGNLIEYKQQIVNGLSEHAHKIFTIKDVTDYFPVFSVFHAMKILEVFNDIFGDITNLDTMIDLVGLDCKSETSIPVAESHRPYEYEHFSDSSCDAESDMY